MKLNKSAMKDVINYIIENQTFDFGNGKMSSIYLTAIVNGLSGGDDDKMQEIACAIVRCINEGFLKTNYPRTAWAVAQVEDVTLLGFQWVESN